MGIPRVTERRGAYIGRSNWDQDEYFKGSMDDARIYNRPLSADEIRKLAATGK